MRIAFSNMTSFLLLCWYEVQYDPRIGTHIITEHFEILQDLQWEEILTPPIFEPGFQAVLSLYSL